MLTKDDSLKLGFDFFKHLTTLNTACILLMAGLIERVFVNPVNAAHIEYMFLSFVISLLSSLAMMVGILYLPMFHEDNESKPRKVQDRNANWFALVGTIVLIGATGGFLYGLFLAKSVISDQRSPQARTQPVR